MSLLVNKYSLGLKNVWHYIVHIPWNIVAAQEAEDTLCLDFLIVLCNLFQFLTSA